MDWCVSYVIWQINVMAASLIKIVVENGYNKDYDNLGDEEIVLKLLKTGEK